MALSSVLSIQYTKLGTIDFSPAGSSIMESGSTLPIENQIEGKTIKEKADIKSAEIVRRYEKDIKQTYTDLTYGLTVEIQKISKIEGGIEIFARAWEGTDQLGFGRDGSIEIEHFKIFNPPILIDDPLGSIIRKGSRSNRRLREDPVAAIRQSLAHTISVSSKRNSHIVKGKIGNTTSTFFPAAGANSPVDGRVFRNPAQESFASLRGGAGTTANDTDADNDFVSVQAGTTTDQLNLIIICIFLFDTSSIGSGNSVDSATLSIRGTTRNDVYSQSILLTDANPASNSTLATGDYTNKNTNMATEVASGRITIASWSTTGYNDYTLNAAGITNISLTSISKFGARISADFDNTAPTWSSGAAGNAGCAFADTAGTASDPKLVVVYSASSDKSSAVFSDF